MRGLSPAVPRLPLLPAEPRGRGPLAPHPAAPPAQALAQTRAHSRMSPPRTYTAFKLTRSYRSSPYTSMDRSRVPTSTASRRSRCLASTGRERNVNLAGTRVCLE